MDSKQIFIGICLFIVFFSLLSVASASDTTGNVTVTAVSDDSNAISVTNNQDYILGVPSGTFSNLNDTISNSQAGDSITLDRNYTYSNGDESLSQGIIIDKSITIDGQGFTVNASGKASIFSILGNSEVTLKNINFINANGTDGGAIKLDSSASLEIINCNFIDNAATCGGAIYVADSSSLTSNLIVSDSKFINNTARYGGAAYIVADNAAFKNVFFENNNAVDGGAIYWQGHYGSIDGSSFKSNRAIGLGDGALVSTTTNPNTNISEDRFNISGGDGGAIKWTGSHGVILNSTFIENSAAYTGGALYFVGNSTENCTNITFVDCEFTQNTANLNGGALFWASGASNATILSSLFTKNIAARSAGAIYINGNYLEIKDTEFRENSATRSQTYDNRNGSSYFSSLGGNAGAICWMGSYGAVENGTFIKNTAADRGGAIQFERNVNGTVKNSYFEKNSAGDDGGAIDWYLGAVNGQIINSTFKSNYLTGPDGQGAGVYIEGYNATIVDSEFYDHKTDGDGAAIYVAGDECKLFNSTFEDNVAGDDGGAIYWEGDNGIIYNITCANNKGISKTKPDGVSTSSTRGGTLSIIGNNVTLSKSSFTKSKAYMDDGKDHSKVDGGAVFITGNDVTINETEFYDCSAVNNGGAIYIIGNNTKILNCSIEKTQAYIGGAIFIDGIDTVVDSSLFWYNTASGHSATGELGGSGGAIYVQGEGATISNSDFAYGNAVNYGGAISVWGANANITKNMFADSTTDLFYGGSIYINGVNATVSLSNFSGSIAKNQYAHGGAIQVSGDNAKVLECNFEECFAYYGGVIHIDGTNSTIDSSNFQDGIQYRPTGTNKKQYPQEGGAIYVKGSDTTILKSNFTNLDSKQSGGAIYIFGPNTSIEDSNFDNCNGDDGGAIYVYGNYAKISDSTFNSSAAKHGGAIYLFAWGALIKDSNVSDCAAGMDGGAIYVAGGGTNIVGSNFDGCIAKGNSENDGGGAIYIDGPDTHISTSNFNGNEVTSANAHGGTIYIKGERTIIEESSFNRSHASKDGGIIYIIGENAVIRSSEFNNSYSSSKGGAIAVRGHNATIDLSKFENIYANNHGGAIYVDGEETNILRSSFYNCISNGNNGGAIYIDDIKTTVAYSNFTLCKADSAGAIYINGIGTAILYCNLNNNTAGSAGAIKVFGNNTIISNTNLTYNNATLTDGGALDIGGSNASVYSCWFDHNDAVRNGGAINWKGGHGNDTILGSTFTNNGCHGMKEGGGAIFWTSGDPNNIPPGGLILNSIFINNTAHGHHGGAIDWFYARDSTINNCLFINNSAYGDGGALYTGDQNGHGHHLMMSNNQFYNNSAGKHGGAVANQMSDSWIYNNTFDGNKAQASGGTILMKEGHADNSVIDHCYIYNSFIDQTYHSPPKDKENSFGVGGGAIRIDDDNITISNCAIVNSTANKTWGGAILVNSKDSTLVNVTIQNSRMLDGYGGAICWKGDGGTLNNVTIFNSSSTILNDDSAYFNYEKSANGGAIYLSGSNCNLANVSIFKSSTNKDNASSRRANNGGAVYVSGNSNTITNIEIDEASALSVNMNTKGGAIYWSGAAGTLVNATISNALANGQGGAIYWSGKNPVVENISITYSQTNVTNSSNSADGGAIYSTGINNLNNVYITDSIAYTEKGDIRGGAIHYNGADMNNITVIGSRASTGNGTSYGGAVYWDGDAVGNLHNASFEENHADLGGALYSTRTTNVYDASFVGNVAEDGGALYGAKNDDTLTNVSFVFNSAKRGGAIFTDNVQINMHDSTLINNTAEASGAALYRNYVDKGGSSEITNTQMLNNTAYRGSAVYATDFANFAMKDVVLLDNQANANKFIDKTIGVLANGSNYTSAIFLGNDNLLNSMWFESNGKSLYCDNVTYLGSTGITSFTGTPYKNNQEVRQNITVYMFNKKGQLIDKKDVLTDASGKFVYLFDAEKGEIYNFAYEHPSDRYYTYLRDTYSNSSLVEIWINNCTYGENASALISLTDGAWGNLSGNVTVVLNDTRHTNFTVEIINSTMAHYNITGLPVGHYNATATFKGNLTRLGDKDWVLFEVRPYTDLNITKSVNVTGDSVNVTDIIEYTITVRNKGPSASWDVNVTEVLSPYLKLLDNQTTRGYYDYARGVWFIGDLDVYENVTLTIKAQVIHNGPITNTVWVEGAGREVNFTDNVASARNLTAGSFVDLRIVKEVNASEIIDVTDVIKYTITVFNDGPCNATGVYVAENLDSHLKLISNKTTIGKYVNGTWNIGNLAMGANATLTIVAQAIYSGNITNNVNVTSFENDSNPENNYANVSNVAVANVDLQIFKTSNVSSTAKLYDNIKFTISVFNAGPANASGVYVSEILNEHLRLVSNETTIGKYDGATWIIENLNKGEVHNLTIIAEVISVGVITNQVNITGADNDTNLTNNEDNITPIEVLPDIDLSITKTVNATKVNVTDYIKYTITVVNNGPLDATGVNVTEKLSDLLEIAPNGINASKGTYDGEKWVIGDLANQSSATLTIIAKVINNGTIENVVTVTCNESDRNKSNDNCTCDNVTALPVVDLSVTKNVWGPTVVNVTDFVYYDIDVKNNGPCVATDVVIHDLLDSRFELVSFYSSRGGLKYDNVTGECVIGKLDVDEDVFISFKVRVIGVGEIPNTVNVTGRENDTNKSNNRDDAENITALPIVDVKVNKTVSLTEAFIGDNIVYTITVQNNGPCDATDVNVTENLSNKVTLVQYNETQGSYDAGKNIWYVGKLSNGSIASLTLTVRINEIGVIENTVSVISKENDTNKSNNNYACDNVTVSQLDTPIELHTYNITYGDDEVLVITLPTNATGNVNVTVGNRTYVDVPINNGTVELPVTDLGGGDYPVNVTYGGDDKYLPNSTAGIFNVAPVTPIITIEVEDIWVWEIEVLNVTVNAPGSVFVTVYGITVEIPLDNGVVTTDVLAAGTKPDYKGNATWNIIHLPVGTYTGFALYPGNENYTSVNTSDIFHVRDLMPTTVVAVAGDIYVGEDAVINITVGPQGVAGSVVVNVDGTNYTLPIDDNGKATLTVPGLSAGTKNVTVWYGGNDLYLPSENATAFDVLKIKPPVDIYAPEITVGEDGVITVTVPDDATGTITIEIEGKRYTADIENGKAVFVVPDLEVGVHDIIAFYSGDDKYLPANGTGEIKVNPKDEPVNPDEPKKSTIENKMLPTGNPIMALIVVLMSLCVVQIRRFKK